MVRQYREWMRDNWNHPSVVIWDAQNETRADALSEIIAAVRPLDLSNRPWENGYNLPVGPNDPVEDHQYLVPRIGRGVYFAEFGKMTGTGFELSDLEKMTGAKSTNSAHPSGHAVILNEYDWLWLNRDGTPTELTRDVYPKLAGPEATPTDRFALNAYLSAGLTEFWRAHRNFAGVLHFVYLAASFSHGASPQELGAYTSDNFLDIEKLTLEPHFEDYMGEAFKPLGVYLNFWQPALPADSQQRFAVMMLNDEPEAVEGRLLVSLEAADGREAGRRELAFALPGLGQQTYAVDLQTPSVTGKYLLKATAYPSGRNTSPTVSRRKVSIQAR